MQKTLAFAAAVISAAILSAQSSGPAAFDKPLGGDQKILHALNRLTYGPRPGDVAAVEKMGLNNWIDLQLHPERIPEDTALTKLADSFTEPASPFQVIVGGQVTLMMVNRRPMAFGAGSPQVPLERLITAAQVVELRNGSDQQAMAVLASLPGEKAVEVLAVMPAVRVRLLPLLDASLRRKVEAAVPGPVQPGQALAQGKLYRAIQSERQLEEVLVDFWFNHFNVDAGKGAVRATFGSYERDAIRPHVLGKFRDLLGATAHSAAMLVYLDNALSIANKLNENYARELMELHTLGVDGGYTQKDVVEVARCFTGWTIDAPLGGGFSFNYPLHDRGEKTVLGVKIPAGRDKEDGEQVLDILARHPSTARFISKKLAQRFVADDPPAALIERMAQTFRDTGGDLRAVLTTLFGSREFFSEGAYRSKLKTPLEMVVSAVRATGAQVDSSAALASEIATLGQPLYRKGEPTGYSSLETAWLSSASLVERMNFGLRLAQNQIDEVKVDQERFSADPAAAARQVLFADAGRQTLEALGNLVRDTAEPVRGGLIAGMLIGSPEFQRK